MKTVEGGRKDEAEGRDTEDRGGGRELNVWESELKLRVREGRPVLRNAGERRLESAVSSSVISF